MAGLLTTMVSTDPDGVAVIAPGVTHTWRDLDERVNRWASALAGLGLSAGDRVAMMLGNRAEVVEVLLACLHTGLSAVPVNWHLTVPEVSAILTDSGAAALVTDPVHAAVGAGAAAWAGIARTLVAGTPESEALLAAAEAAEPAEQRLGGILMYTSGSSGRPKGVRNGLFRVGAPLSTTRGLLRYAGATLRVPEREVVLQTGPWYHSAQTYFLLTPVLRGCRVVLHERFDPAATLDALIAHRVTACHLVPTQMVRLIGLDPAVRSGFRGGDLRVVWHGGGPCAPDVKRRMIDWWGPVFLEYYGATEGGVATLIDSTEWLQRPGSVGRAAALSEIVVVDEAGEPVPAGEVGRVFVRRQTSFEYHNAPDETRRAHLEPGVFTYGELGRLDEDGYLYLVGRASDRIVSGGVNIEPGEVETVLLSHPAVRDVAVIGVPDREFGERPVAVVELWPGTLEADRVPVVLDGHCRGRLAGFKIPRSFEVTAALPRDQAGKLRRRFLSERYALS